jgi:integrase
MRRAQRLVKLTAEWLASVQVEGREDWHDEGCPGLAVRISGTSKVFYWLGRVAGRAARLKLGKYPAMSVGAARIEAKRLAGEAASGASPKPRSVTARNEMTLGQLHVWYMETHSKPHKRTWETDQRRFDARLGHWRNRKLSSISRAEVAALHVSIGEADGPYAANKMRLGKRVLQITAHDPTEGVTRFAKQERERFLNADELPRFLDAVDKLPRETSRDFLKLCLFTGARRSNVAAMRWDEINLPAKVWIIPGDKAKAGKPITIALPEPAMEILNRRAKDGPWVLPGQGKTGHFVEPKHAMQAALAAAGIKGVRLHDLRRTLGSWMAAAGASLHVIGKTLGHSSPKSTAIYARLNLDPVREAVATATDAMLAKKSEKSS